MSQFHGTQARRVEQVNRTSGDYGNFEELLAAVEAYFPVVR